ncbi:MAG: chromosome segregation ATPase [Leptolyngbya sp. SIO1E4]|nr:chromosome segregation ATPase [Leptolyngbya sp. SIO1E4]
MSSFQNHPQRPSRKPNPPQPADARHWQTLPPPKRDQRPRPGQPQPPQSQRPPMTTPSNAVAPPEVAALRHQMVRPMPPPPTEPPPPPPPRQQPQRRPLTQRWTLWAFLALAGLGGLAGVSAVSLFRIPNLPNCRAIFWPTASAATRLQCADAYADQGNVDSLLAAISLVAALSDDHPLSPEIDERIEIWAGQILNIADYTFHQGDLEEAIKIAERIPENTAAADVVSDRITAWQGIWEQAESIFKEAEGHLKASQFREAFSTAVQLRSVENDYWSTTRHEELVSLITQTRTDVNALANAERIAQGGMVDDVLEALEQVAAISPESYVYERAQGVLKDLSRQLLDLAEEALARGNGAEALDILNKIPSEARLEAEIADFRTLQDAYELTWAGTTVGYEAAIVRLQSIGRDRPLHSRAQALRQQWQWELEAIAQLNWAKRIAQPGSVADLRAAIAEADKIGSDNPRWGETQAQIQEWQADIAEIEDRPFIDRAQGLASQGDSAALQAAIEEASNVPTSSPLYDEAQDAVADWRWRIQEMNNEPLLAQARQLAELGRFPQAIAVASQIPPNQALHEEAQTEIANWQDQQQGIQSYQQAFYTAQSGSVEALAQAIALAQEVPEDSPEWQQAQQAANEWSWELLEMAEAAAERDLSQGIVIAGQIPPRTEAYAEAQLSLRNWQDRLTQ